MVQTFLYLQSRSPGSIAFSQPRWALLYVTRECSTRTEASKLSGVLPPVHDEVYRHTLFVSTGTSAWVPNIPRGPDEFQSFANAAAQLCHQDESRTRTAWPVSKWLNSMIGLALRPGRSRDLPIDQDTTKVRTEVKGALPKVR